MPEDKSPPARPGTVDSDSPVASPLVSCLMPTRDRRPFVPLALGYFLRQDYPNRELVILDDGDDPVADLIPDDPRIRYHRLDRPRRLGTKRNLACEEARGDVLIHWDDDDWMAPWRLRYQVEGLLTRKAELCGVDRLYFLAPETDQAWEYIYPAGDRPWLAGGTLCFTRDFWRRHPFLAMQKGEDTHFVLSARGARLARLADHRFYVALVHGGNTDVKRTEGDRWHRRDSEAVWALLGEDGAAYRRAREETHPRPPTRKRSAPQSSTQRSPTQSSPAVLRGRPQFLAALRVEDGAERIGEAVASVLPLCERVLVFDDHSSDATAEICRALGPSVEVLPSPFDGHDEARDKNFLLAAAHDEEPEWVLWIDGDEVLEKKGPQRLRRRVARAGGHHAFSLRIAYLWDDERRVRTDGIFGRAFRPSLFRLAGRPRDSLRFLPTGNGADFPCGNVPAGLPGTPGLAAVRLKHYGYLTREQRQRKYPYSERIDPGNAADEAHGHLAGIPGARLAAGAPRFEPWTD